MRADPTLAPARDPDVPLVDTVATAPGMPDDAAPRGHSLVIVRLAAALAAEGVRCCQWKGYAKRSRWASGEGDLDLLVDRTMAPAFARVLEGLGFKLALPGAGRQVPGVVSYIGHDPVLRRLLHVHAHYHLVVGPGWARHYHLPLERVALDTSVRRAWFHTPAPEVELILLVLHSTLRHGVQDAVRGDPYWFRALQPGLDDLETQADAGRLRDVLAAHLPDVPPTTFARCRDSLRPDTPWWRRMAARRTLERGIAAHAYRPPAGTALRLTARRAARLVWPTARWLREPGKLLASGGSVIALVGADGAGKSTSAAALVRWLNPQLETTWAHLGRPPRSLATLLIGFGLRLARRLDGARRTSVPSRLTEHAELLRCLGTARDRYRLYRRVRRAAAGGAIAICERYPVPESYALAGPSETQGMAVTARGRLADWMRRAERRYYGRILGPDLLLVLQVDPETAVRRKTDEPEGYVRDRARLLHRVDWSNRSARLVNAAKPLSDVVAELRSAIWEAL